MLETLHHTICIGSTPTFLYFDLYLYSAYAAHYVYVNKDSLLIIVIFYCFNFSYRLLFMSKTKENRVYTMFIFTTATAQNQSA